MKAAIINRYGDPEVLQYAEVEKPRIKPKQMLVRVYASSINPIDWKIRAGMLKILTGNKFPMILGFDVAGEVVEVNGITQFKPGDQIYAHLNQLPGGAYAEYAVVAALSAAAKPTNMSYEEAASVPLAAMTALQAWRDESNLKPGQKVLVNGASGGVGIFAVQIAKVLGAEVTAVCGTSNLEMAKSLGADRVIDYKQQDFTQDTTKYDIVFDVVGNSSLSTCKNILQPNGIYVTTQPYPGNYFQSFITGFLPGQKYKVILLKSRGSDLAYLKQQIEAGKIRTIIDSTYPLSEIASAHTYSEAGHAVGKIVVSG